MDNLTIIDIIVMLIGVFLVTVFGVVPLAMATFVILRTLAALLIPPVLLLIAPPMWLYQNLKGKTQ